jgi:TRAP transporter 4TM/12TM fusion protein
MHIDEKETDMMLEHDSGARHPDGFSGTLLLWIAVAWSLFQLWVASPFVYFEFFTNSLGIPVLNDTQVRSIHLGFALFLVFMSFPARGASPRAYVPLTDWIFALAGAYAGGYLFLHYAELAGRAGLPTDQDLIVAGVGGLMLLEATRRSLGWPLVILAGLCLGYIYYGQQMPDVISHKGASLNKIASHLWISTEGVFGIALGVSASFVFLFVLFGALLDKAGAGNYFIKCAFALLGHLRGGPAKAAVLASGFTGLISGSSIANVVTTGTFTIPLMKRVGFTAEKAGAVEVSGSVNGQIMPPVMGAAAFLMVEYVGIPYIEVIKHAFIPAVISYISLLYIVHLEALKQGIEGIEQVQSHHLKKRLIVHGINISSVLIVVGLITGFVMGTKELFGEQALWVIIGGLIVLYFGLLYVSSQYPPLEQDDPDNPEIKMPELKPTVMSGLHYLVPLVVLIWCLMVERLSPGLSAFYATLVMICILVTQKPILSLFRTTWSTLAAFKEGLVDLKSGLEAGARNMISIAIATATAGVIVGTVTLTGIANVMPSLIDALAGDSLFLVLLFTAIVCLILGMGLPTTANYIVVSSIMVGVIQELGAQHGLIVPLIAIHLFVFYFGIMADVTPPVGLASFAAAAVSNGDPIKTGLQAFWYSIRTAILPFIFIFNHELLLIDVNSWVEGVFIFLYSATAIMVLTAVLQGYFITKTKWWENILLLLVAVTMFRPALWMDMVYPPYQTVEPTAIEKYVGKLADESEIKLHILGEDAIGEPRSFYVYLTLDEPTPTGAERLMQSGLRLRYENEKALVDHIAFFSQAEKKKLLVNNEIIGVYLPQAQPNPRWLFIPALLLLAGIISLQRRRLGSRG